METRLDNIFFGLGLALYAAAGITAVFGIKSSFVILLGAVIFLAFGFYANVKLRWAKKFRKKD